MAKQVRTRLADRHRLKWLLLDGMSIMEWRRITDKTARQQALLKIQWVDYDVIAFNPHDETAFQNGQGLEPPPDPTFPTGQWWLNGVAPSCKTFDTPTKELGPHEMWQDAERIVWKDENDEYKEALVNDVVITLKTGRVETIVRKSEATR